MGVATRARIRRGGVAGSHEENASKVGVVEGSNGCAAGQGGSERLILTTNLHPSFAINVGIGFRQPCHRIKTTTTQEDTRALVHLYD